MRRPIKAPARYPTLEPDFADVPALVVAHGLGRAKIKFCYQRLGDEHAFVLPWPLTPGILWFAEHAPGWRWDPSGSCFRREIER